MATLIRASAAPTTKIRVPMTLTAGGTPNLEAPATHSGNVEVAPALKSVIT
jgi:hypothetical protein